MVGGANGIDYEKRRGGWISIEGQALGREKENPCEEREIPREKNKTVVVLRTKKEYERTGMLISRQQGK